MTIKHNQKIAHNHFRKDWQRYVRVHFDQPGQKVRRRKARAAKAARVAPRPVDKLRPEVQCPTIKYNHRARLGRGFSLQELKAAGVPRKLAPTIGISVDPRRENTSEESLQRNVKRLKEYMTRVVVFPRKGGKKGSRKLDGSSADVKALKQGDKVSNVAAAFPPSKPVAVGEVKLSEVQGEENAFRTLRTARSDARLAGVREKRRKAKEEEAAAAKK